jgi:hypothetical protein
VLEQHVTVALSSIEIAEKERVIGHASWPSTLFARIGGDLRCLGETLSELECFEKFATIKLVDAQAQRARSR